MKIKLFIFIAALSFFTLNSFAQQEAQFTMFWNNYSLINPGASGLFYKHYASLTGRHQWVDFGGEPMTISAVYDFRWDKRFSGIGVNYLYDQLGFEKNNKVNLNYAYQLKMKKNAILSLGVSFGMLRKSIDFSKFTPINPNDPLLNSSPKADVLYDFNIGDIIKTPHFLIGLSATQLNESESKKLNYKNSRHYYFLCSYNSDIGKNLNLKPSVFIKTDFASTQYDINLVATLKKHYWAGVDYRHTDAVAFMAGIDIKGKYRIGYSYDHTISEMADYSKGSHEVVLALMVE